MPPSSRWSTERVRSERARTNAIRDRQNFSGRGRYLSPPKGPGPGRGPYPWRVWETTVEQPVGTAATSLSGTEREGWYRCPATSHLEAIRYVHGLDDTDDDILEILFKKGKKRLYQYFGKGQARKLRLETCYDMMRSAQRPGELVWSVLSAEKFPYA